MKLFNTLSLELTSDCNRKCKFCPVSQYTRPAEELPKSLVTKALEELIELKYHGRVEFYIYNEPLKNPEPLHYALEQFSEHLPRATLMIATNGDYLRSPEGILDLFDRGLNQLILNAYSPQQAPRFQEWLDSIPEINQTKNVYKPAAKKAKIAVVMDKSSSTEFGTGVHSLQNRAGSIPDFLPPVKEPLEKMCVKPFRLLNIDWRGEALLCCNDYYGQLRIGNLANNSLFQLWNHPVMNTYRKRLYKKDRTLPLCRVCDCHAGAYPHLVDTPSGPYASKLVIESRFKTVDEATK